MVRIYGIKNCNTVKKALTWFDENGIAYEFHDFKKLGVSRDKLEEWGQKLGWEPLVNKKGTTWKQLDQLEQQRVTDASSAYAMLGDKTSMIKRPVVENGNDLILGFDETTYEESFK